VRLIERVWSGETTGDRLARLALAPLEGVYRSAAAVRAELYDRGILGVAESPIAVVSVGNLTVGGTGKTPVAAWVAARLAAHGRVPAIVLRGYGGDESVVHSRLNPSLNVIVAGDRRIGITNAAAAGADAAVLDDAFQHRKASRDLDLVLVSADDWSGNVRMLPAGPFREPLSALRRASAVIVTGKAATGARIDETVRAVENAAPRVPVVVISLGLSGLVSELPRGLSLPLSALESKRVTAVAAVGNPEAFFRQLEATGATVARLPFPDQHPFTPEDASKILAASRAADFVLCTLKDAVKLGPLWPAGETPLWYVSLSVEVESGGAALDDMLMRLPQAHSR